MVFRQSLQKVLQLDTKLFEQGLGRGSFVFREVAEVLSDVLLGQLGSGRGAGCPVASHEAFPDLGDGFFSFGTTLTGSGVAQLNLFDDNRLRANSAALMETIDSVNHSGKGKIWFAGQGIEKSWAMKREMLSPAYTTRYADLPVAK